MKDSLKTAPRSPSLGFSIVYPIRLNHRKMKGITFHAFDHARARNAG
ncbi:hypothetical protein [Rheinheimera oceanensis]|nr:hypothetical protein [Rheinheimera oceanensis]